MYTWNPLHQAQGWLAACLLAWLIDWLIDGLMDGWMDRLGGLFHWLHDLLPKTTCIPPKIYKRMEWAPEAVVAHTLDTCVSSQLAQ